MDTQEPPTDIDAEEPFPPPTVVAPCPAFDRLDELMNRHGKLEADAWVPGQIGNLWWRRRNPDPEQTEGAA